MSDADLFGDIVTLKVKTESISLLSIFLMLDSLIGSLSLSAEDD